MIDGDKDVPPPTMVHIIDTVAKVNPPPDAMHIEVPMPIHPERDGQKSGYRPDGLVLTLEIGTIAGVRVASIDPTVDQALRDISFPLHGADELMKHSMQIERDKECMRQEINLLYEEIEKYLVFPTYPPQTEEEGKSLDDLRHGTMQSLKKRIKEEATSRMPKGHRCQKK